MLYNRKKLITKKKSSWTLIKLVAVGGKQGIQKAIRKRTQRVL